MAGKDIDINSEIVEAIAVRMHASLLLLAQHTGDFAKDWMVIKDSFDDTSKKKIDRVIVKATTQINGLIKSQKASFLMREYVDALTGKN